MRFDESGMYLMTLGGNDRWTISLWKVKDLVSLSKDNQMIKAALAICEL